MAEKCKVSVVVPVYNASSYLRECMDSVLEQSLKEFEMICIDDGSTDDSLHILEEYAASDSRVKIIAKENSGYGSTVNLGISHATGEYISIIEPDDYIEDDMYRTLYDAALQYDLDIISSDYKWFYDDVGKRIFERHTVYNDSDLYDKVLNPGEDIRTFQGQFINPAGLFRRRFLHDHNITHNETPGAAFQDRGFFFLSMVQAKRIMVLPLEFYNYRHDNPNSSISGRNDMDKVITEYNLILERLLGMGDKYREFLSEHFRREYESCRYALSRSSDNVKKDALYKMSEVFRGYEDRGILDISGMRSELRNELQSVMRAPEEAYRSLMALKDEVHVAISGYKSFVIYGAGVVGKRIYRELSDADRVKCLGFAVSDMTNQPPGIDALPIRNIKDYADKKDETAVIMAVTPKYRDEMTENLVILGFQNIITPKSMGADL